MRKPAVLAAVLAGGSGTRLGGEKVSAPLGGRPLVSYPLAAAAAAGLPAVLVAKPDTRLPELDVQVVREPALPRHPLCGLMAALRHAETSRTEAVLALACDTPFLTGELLGWMAGLDGSVLLRAGGRVHALPVRCPVSALAPLQARLDSAAPLRDALAELEPRVVEEHELLRFGEPGRLLLNVNSADDLAGAGALLAQP
jgi:molybdenum cofactor guanylyltransferase